MTSISIRAAGSSSITGRPLKKVRGWHVQNETNLQELQQLSGWSSFEMVLRYAHLSSEHLKQAAKRIQRNTGNQQQAELNYCGLI